MKLMIDRLNKERKMEVISNKVGQKRFIIQKSICIVIDKLHLPLNKWSEIKMNKTLPYRFKVVNSKQD